MNRATDEKIMESVVLFQYPVVKPTATRSKSSRYGLPEKHGTDYGVYVLESFEMARRFALPIKPLLNGTMAIYFDDSTCKVTIKAGTLDRDSIGYVYKVPSDTFVKLDEHQWISICDVVPLEKTVVNTDDLWNGISFG